MPKKTQSKKAPTVAYLYLIWKFLFFVQKIILSEEAKFVGK